MEVLSFGGNMNLNRKFGGKKSIEIHGEQNVNCFYSLLGYLASMMV